MKWLVAALATAAFAVAAYWAYPFLREESPTVRVVDRSAELRQASDARRIGLGYDPVDRTNEGYPPPLVREPLDEATVELFFPSVDSNESCLYDPHEYTRRAPHFDRWFPFNEHPDGGWRLRTNALGMRSDGEVAEVAPDLRVLVTGDSHVEGVCANSESCASVLERLLAEDALDQSVEVLNAGAGAHHLFNYVGTFERFAYLEPDVFVVIVYGGNDFSGAMLLDRYFRRRPAYEIRPNMIEQQSLPESVSSLLPQELSQDIYFANNPEDVEAAVDLGCSVSVELSELCAERGTRLLFVYLPPPTRAQPEVFREDLERLMKFARMESSALGVSDRIADEWLQFLADRGLDHLDLRPAFRAAEEPLFWRTDHHLNVAGHRLVGERIHAHLRGDAPR
ncbi:MAG: hypothetical protein H6831_12210 [Planctomycetes bacterium]|nr:SGNH/GDSL hydrolase family protein [Planctomycetota bacterium]MCB9905165.1 hypothetical protein [Planctomycetota bacterium]